MLAWPSGACPSPLLQLWTKASVPHLLKQGMLLGLQPRVLWCPVQIYKEGSLTSEKLRETGVAWKDVFEEIPIHVRNSPLAAAMLACVEPEVPRCASTCACTHGTHLAVAATCGLTVACACACRGSD